MEPGLCLLGVVHRDPQGESRLLAALRKLQPEAVGVEMAAPSVALRRERGPELRRRLGEAFRALGRDDLLEALEAGADLPGVAGELASALAVPYELRAAEAWARESGASVELLDDPGLAERGAALLEQGLLEPAGVKALLDEEAKVGRHFDPVFEQYALARRYFGNAQLFRYHFGAEEVALLEARARYVAAGLERLTARFGRVVHVAGWEQLVDGGLGTLWPALKDRAQRLLVPDLEES